MVVPRVVVPPLRRGGPVVVPRMVVPRVVVPRVVVSPPPFLLFIFANPGIGIGIGIG